MSARKVQKVMVQPINLIFRSATFRFALSITINRVTVVGISKTEQGSKFGYTKM